MLPARREKTFSSVWRPPPRLAGGGDEGGVVSEAVSLQTHTHIHGHVTQRTLVTIQPEKDKDTV